MGGLNRVTHVWPYESFEDRERIGGEARKTGKWPPKTQEFIVTQENKIIQPAPFSPPLPEGKLGELYEFRTYTYQPGTMPTVLERFGKVIPARTKISPLVFAGQTMIGPLNQYIQFGPTKTPVSASDCAPKRVKPWKVGRRRRENFWSCRKI